MGELARHRCQPVGQALRRAQVQEALARQRVGARTRAGAGGKIEKGWAPRLSCEVGHRR